MVSTDVMASLDVVVSMDVVVSSRYRHHGQAAPGVPHSTAEARATGRRAEAGSVRGRTTGENGIYTSPVIKLKYSPPELASSWWRGPAVEHWFLADVLSLSCARLVADG